MAWAIFGGTILVLGLFSVLFTRHYQSLRETELSATVVTITGLTVIFGSIAVIPLDIFLVSNTVDLKTGLKKEWADESTIYWMTLAVQCLYYVFYGLIMLFSFLIVPFAYAYYEEYDVQRRAMTAFKYSCGLSIFGSLLFLFALFVKPNVLPLPIDLEWFINLLMESNGAKAFWFVVGFLFIPGMVIFIVYTAPGLSLIPFRLIKGKNEIEIKHDEMNQKLIHVREQQKMIEQKYAGSNAAMSTHDYTLLANFRDEERIVLRLIAEVEEVEHGILQRIFKILRPFETLIGIVLLLLTVLIIASIFITIIDKVIFSVCGSECGYIIGQSYLFNPIDFVFLQLQKLFPLDFVLMIAIMIYFFLATVMGITRIGVKFLWVTLYRIRRKATAPQGLLITTLFSTLGLLAFTYSITSEIAPSYTHFGSQVYCNYTEGGVRNCTGREDEIFPCDVWAPLEICTPTVTSVLLDRITLNTPFFGLIFYYSQWIFLGAFILGFLVALFRSPKDWERQEEEERGLLDGHDHFHHQDSNRVG